jgi:RND family efflux transporter MFP subunit
MRTLHKTLIATALAAVLIVPLIDFDADASTPAAAPQPPPPPVSVAAAVTTELAPRHWAPGSVISRKDARVASEQSGRVVRVAEVGQYVRAGEAIAVLDDTALRLREREHQAELARTQAQLGLATRQEQRYSQLAAEQNIARAQHDQLRSERDALAQDLARSQSLLEQTRHQRAQMVVRAPFAGVVAERLVQLGEYVTGGAAVARVVDTATREVRVRAPVDLARHISVGMPVQVRAGGKEQSHPVSAMVPVGDEASRQLELRIALGNEVLPVGSAVEVGLPSDSPRVAVAVPRDAVILRREGNFVLRVGSDGKAERVPVQSGTEVGDLIEVSGAVRAGDRLIVRGGERVEAGQLVTIQAMARTVTMADARAPDRSVDAR